MTDSFDDQKWIREIAMHIGRKYTTDNIDRTSRQRLADFGWLTPFVINASDVEYVATDQGKAAVKIRLKRRPDDVTFRDVWALSRRREATRKHFVKGKTIKEIARDLKVSRNTVRKVLRSGEIHSSMSVSSSHGRSWDDG
jgi:hypothetical protein